ncbi:hypothetical protein EV1_031391 [Malus domestica]
MTMISSRMQGDIPTNEKLGSTDLNSIFQSLVSFSSVAPPPQLSPPPLSHPLSIIIIRKEMSYVRSGYLNLLFPDDMLYAQIPQRELHSLLQCRHSIPDQFCRVRCSGDHRISAF